MSKKNKCVGLDCAFCANTKCPNEEKETIINGIDVSEEIRELVSNEIDKTDKDDELMQIYGTIYNRCNEVLNDRD